MRDSAVSIAGSSLTGKTVHLVVTGGIAAVETVRLARELRRHGATIEVTMTDEATKIITPLAVGWATGSRVNVGWSSDLPGLEVPDIVVVAPATRNTLSKISSGVMDDPAMMAISAASGAGRPILLVPSMHDDLFDDPVTQELLATMRGMGHHVLTSPSEEGRRKQPLPEVMVRRVCHLVNGDRAGLCDVAVFYGATSSNIDPVRVITNTSSGRTGFMVSDHLERMGHNVTRVVGSTSTPHDHSGISARTPSDMIEAASLISSEATPDVWVIAAAVLDFEPSSPTTEKISSKTINTSIDLSPAPRLIEHIREISPESRVISFKLESGITEEELIERARSHMQRAGTSAVVANLLEGLEGEGPRGYLVQRDSVATLEAESDLCEGIEALILGWGS
tara:strand:- start:1137 stop:2318 length:1182 start_codon:yes stop_codon:yes gene_type:complete